MTVWLANPSIKLTGWLGIVGFGEIGKAVARKLTAFEPSRIIVSQPREPSAEELDLGYGKKV